MPNIKVKARDGATVTGFVSDVVPRKGDKIELRKGKVTFYKVSDVVYVVEGQNAHIELVVEEQSTTSI
jgi:hypothetical protein